jgi:hypothetical protein
MSRVCLWGRWREDEGSGVGATFFSSLLFARQERKKCHQMSLFARERRLMSSADGKTEYGEIA